ncbi:unnamed protein product [Cladocopium goreaui]|uniref:Structural maintenance of chromosomes protein 1 (SMC protein 1) (SMC-1) (Chromosome segregation protein SMC-1) (Cohesin complex subunit SMC-1) (Protein TITAN8) n=1 Tax=Cladocopium goreaui TaxID=2562237 RepID=A0A9P1DNU2_9DINO|nr:unnamed protein product [Cladocopium goreaui]
MAAVPRHQPRTGQFTAMPPSKRFCDMALLSGGEKTVAAMSLLFAIQAYQRPPFLVLDEIDAHLDHSNVLALAKFIDSIGCQQGLPDSERQKGGVWML